MLSSWVLSWEICLVLLPGAVKNCPDMHCTFHGVFDSLLFFQGENYRHHLAVHYLLLAYGEVQTVSLSATQLNDITGETRRITNHQTFLDSFKRSRMNFSVLCQTDIFHKRVKCTVYSSWCTVQFSIYRVQFLVN